MAGTVHEVKAKPTKSECVTPARSERLCKDESNCSPGAPLLTPTVAASPNSVASSGEWEATRTKGDTKGQAKRSVSGLPDPDESFKAMKRTPEESGTEAIVESRTKSPNNFQAIKNVQEAVQKTLSEAIEKNHVQKAVQRSPSKAIEKSQVQEAVQKSPSKAIEKSQVQEAVQKSPSKAIEKSQVQEAAKSPSKAMQKSQVHEAVQKSPSKAIEKSREAVKSQKSPSKAIEKSLSPESKAIDYKTQNQESKTSPSKALEKSHSQEAVQKSPKAIEKSHSQEAVQKSPSSYTAGMKSPESKAMMKSPALKQKTS